MFAHFLDSFSFSALREFRCGWFTTRVELFWLSFTFPETCTFWWTVGVFFFCGTPEWLFLTLWIYSEGVLCSKGWLGHVTSDTAESLSPNHVVLGKDLPGPFSWISGAGGALPATEGVRDDGTKLDIARGTTDFAASCFQTRAAFKFVFQKANPVAL